MLVRTGPIPEGPGYEPMRWHPRCGAHPIALHQDALDPKPAVGDVLGAEQSGCWTSDGAEIHSWSVYPHRPEGAFDADIEMGQ
jgi:hypothetical protein